MKYIFNVVSIKTVKFTLVMNGLPLRLKSKNVFVVYLLFWLIKWLINITILRFPKRLHMVFIRRNAWRFLCPVTWLSKPIRWHIIQNQGVINSFVAFCLFLNELQELYCFFPKDVFSFLSRYCFALFFF